MDTIGRYQIRKELGRGAMGVVYLADDPTIGRQVAIKTVRLDHLSQLRQEEMLRRRLFREAQSAGMLSHPGIITIYDFTESDGIARIVMQYVPGKTLHEAMLRERFDSTRTLDLLEQIAQALDYAHSKGVLHCDIKPENLIVTREGSVKVMDFGIARIVSEATMLNGMILGTPSYMSPEQVLGGSLTGATDQYSMAVIAFELLARTKPFEAASVPDLLHRIAYEAPAFERLRARAPGRAAAVLKRALSKDPTRRYRTCCEMVASLRAACQVRSWAAEALPLVTLVDSISAKRARRWPVVAAGSSLLLAAGLITASSHFRKPQPVGPQFKIDRPADLVSSRPRPVARTPEPQEWSVAVLTIPPGGVVSAAGRYCVAPCRIWLRRGDHYVTAKLSGFQTQHRLVQVPKQSSLRIDLPGCNDHPFWAAGADGCQDKRPARKESPSPDV